jgi:hypothetical protein
MDDCVICVVAMVMGHPYDYERVLIDSVQYHRPNEQEKFIDWWRYYLGHQGFQTIYRPFMDLYSLPNYGGEVVGILHLTIPHLQRGHIVAADELGIVDPAAGAPDHVGIQEYVLNRLTDRVVFDTEFLAVRKMPDGGRN